MIDWSGTLWLNGRRIPWCREPPAGGQPIKAPGGALVPLEAVADVRQVVGPRQITDAYLLALAVARDRTLVTLDRSLPSRLVRGASERHLTPL